MLLVDINNLKLLNDRYGHLVGPDTIGREMTPDIGASLGFAVWLKDGAPAKALLAAADQRMYANKHRHRRQIA